MILTLRRTYTENIILVFPTMVVRETLAQLRNKWTIVVLYHSPELPDLHTYKEIAVRFLHIFYAKVT